MVNRGRGSRYHKMIIEAKRIIKKKNLEIEYRKTLQNLIDRTNQVLTTINSNLENEVTYLGDELKIKQWLYEMVLNNNNILLDEVANHKKIIETLKLENENYKLLLFSSPKVEKTKTN